MTDFNIIKIINKNSLDEAIDFIHRNNFSFETEQRKICKNFDGRVLGLLLKNNKEKIIACLFYYYQPDIKVEKKIFKVVNFSTIFINEEFRGRGLLSIMLKKTIEIFEGYIITDYTPVPKVRHLLSKLGFGYMKNNRKLILPIPNLVSITKFQIGNLEKLENKYIFEKVFDCLDRYRDYEIDLWKYSKNNKDIIIGTTFKNHEKTFLNFKIKTSSVRILWSNDEEFLLREANNLSFLFYLKTSKKFITMDTELDHKKFFAFNLQNQFMVFPKINIKVSPIGSEFFAGVI